MGISGDFNKAAAAAKFELSAYEPSQLCESNLPEIIFSGKSNVGKSSMINKLVNRKALAKVSSSPGKTVSINFYDCGLFRLVDLPGYGYAKVSKQDKEKWSSLIDAYFNGGRNIALIVQLIDARHAPSQGDLQMIDYMTSLNLPFIIALTKSDKLKKSEIEKRREEITAELGSCNAKTIFTSSETGMGFDELKQEILTACSQAQAD